MKGSINIAFFPVSKTHTHQKNTYFSHT